MKNARRLVGERYGKKSFTPGSAMVGSIITSSARPTASSSPALATISIATTKPLLRSAAAYLAAFMIYLAGFPDCVVRYHARGQRSFGADRSILDRRRRPLPVVRTGSFASISG